MIASRLSPMQFAQRLHIVALLCRPTIQNSSRERLHSHMDRSSSVRKGLLRHALDHQDILRRVVLQDDRKVLARFGV